jgi:hypothetical protein
MVASITRIQFPVNSLPSQWSVAIPTERVELIQSKTRMSTD